MYVVYNCVCVFTGEVDVGIYRGRSESGAAIGELMWFFGSTAPRCVVWGRCVAFGVATEWVGVVLLGFV